MAPVKTAPGWHDEPRLRMRRPALLFAVLTATVAAPLALFAWLMPPILVLPTFGLLSIILAAAFAVADRPARRTAAQPTFRDIAGAFALVGAAATILADPDQTARWLGL